VRTSEKKKRATKQTKLIKAGLFKKFKLEVIKFWNGDLDNFPEKSKFLKKSI
jgi:hypothetical protein